MKCGYQIDYCFSTERQNLTVADVLPVSTTQDVVNSVTRPCVDQMLTLRHAADNRAMWVALGLTINPIF